MTTRNDNKTREALEAAVVAMNLGLGWITADSDCARSDQENIWAARHACEEALAAEREPYVAHKTPLYIHGPMTVEGGGFEREPTFDSNRACTRLCDILKTVVSAYAATDIPLPSVVPSFQDTASEWGEYNGKVALKNKILRAAQKAIYGVE